MLDGCPGKIKFTGINGTKSGSEVPQLHKAFSKLVEDVIQAGKHENARVGTLSTTNKRAICTGHVVGIIGPEEDGDSIIIIEPELIAVKVRDPSYCGP